MEEIFLAIDKFFLFSQNYVSKSYTYKNMWGEEITDVLPTFIMEVKWTCNRDHIISKWKLAERENYWGRINYFYADLDNANRKALIAWIMDNFK